MLVTFLEKFENVSMILRTSLAYDYTLTSDWTTGTRSIIAVCYGYRIKLYRINIIRDMVMQLNFTYLPKTGQHSKHIVASQTSWL